MQGIAWLKKLEGLNGEETEVPEESEEVQVLKDELEKTKVTKEKLKVVVTRVRKECDRLKDINMFAAEVLEQEMKKARKEEWSRNKFRGALLGSSNELKLRKVEKDKSRMENVMLKDELRNCQESKGSLKEQLSKMEKNMVIIIDQYKEKVNLATGWGQVLRDEQTKASSLQVEREAREEVIELLHWSHSKWKSRASKAASQSQDGG